VLLAALLAWVSTTFHLRSSLVWFFRGPRVASPGYTATVYIADISIA
jgi:hypothetical protein